MIANIGATTAGAARRAEHRAGAAVAPRRRCSGIKSSAARSVDVHVAAPSRRVERESAPIVSSTRRQDSHCIERNPTPKAHSSCRSGAQREVDERTVLPPHIWQRRSWLTLARKRRTGVSSARELERRGET